MTGFFFSSSFDKFSRPLQLILVLLYLHGTTLHVFRPKSQLNRITTYNRAFFCQMDRVTFWLDSREVTRIITYPVIFTVLFIASEFSTLGRCILKRVRFR
jgi:hypothetical protein